MNRKNNVLSEIRKLDRMVPSADEKTASEYLCADGKAQIDINLYEGAQLFNPLTFGRQRDLSTDIYELIDAKLYTIPMKYPIRLCFHGQIPDVQTQKEVQAVVQEHYLYLVRDKKEDLRINRLKTICMAAFGAVLLSVYFALELTAVNPVFMEFLSIAGWVAAWEAVESWLLERKAIKIEYMNAGQAALSEVTFSEALPYSA